VGILADERERLGTLRWRRPLQRGRDIGTIAGVLLRDVAALGERRALQLEAHRRAPWYRERRERTCRQRNTAPASTRHERTLERMRLAVQRGCALGRQGRPREKPRNSPTSVPV